MPRSHVSSKSFCPTNNSSFSPGVDTRVNETLLLRNLEFRQRTSIRLADLPKEENSKFGSTGPYGQVHRKPILEREGKTGGERRERNRNAYKGAKINGEP